ncbi:hypothetical protein [Carboxylicivirga sp. N1Y90]|uniref:hypothetical protein n=1 Tax=Carboxylicivirga fragile TaxID=3417571 RepID=UPI003D3446A9|nr:hypothetical protein [Marinilabiliaceae bacterium N1Y90]
METYITSNVYSYMIVFLSDKELPGTKEDQLRCKNMERLQVLYPYLCHILSRTSNIMRISRFKAFWKNDTYSFTNAQDGVTWTDVKVYIAPLLLALMRDELFKDVVAGLDQNLYKQSESNEFEMDWKVFFECLPEGHKSSFQNKLNVHQRLSSIQINELIDKSYDEIKITLLNPQTYQHLFAWFGEALLEIGYKAFDFFMEKRDGEQAWKKALQWQIKSYKLSTKLEQELLDKHLYPLLKF